MKSILFLICCAAFFQNFALGNFQPNEDDQIMGVSQRKLRDYMIKAIEGFRKMMPKGDQELGYPVMDPLAVEDVSWNFVDTTGSKKYNLNFMNKNTTMLKGFSNFEFYGVKVDAKDMILSFELIFNNLQTEFPYKLDGYMFKNFMPIYGEGVIKIDAPHPNIYFNIDLATEQSYIMVKEVSVFRAPFDNIKIQATGLLDLPDAFASLVLDDIVSAIERRHGFSALSNFFRNAVEEAIGGMTTNEFFEYLDHFVKKSEEL